MAQVLINHWKVALLWVVSLVVVGVVVASAQALRPVRVVTATPLIVSGSDIGFRIDRTINGVPSGTLVVRIDGKWVDVASGPILKPAAIR